MSEGLKSIVVKFAADTVGLEAGAAEASKALGDVSKAAEAGASGWDKFSKAAGVAGVALLGALGEGLKIGIENMEALDEANVALTTTIGNMPKSLGVTTEALDAQAEALQAHTTFTRDDILAADNLILKNSALQRMIAAGSLTTKQASTDVLNLATVMGEDASTAAAQYAKILSNPFSATKLLTQAGVVLTTSQAAQIAAWKKSGDTAKAQALILGLLEAKTKDAADAAGQTLPAKLQQAKEAFSDAAGKLTESLIPALDTVVGWMTKVSAWATANPGEVKVVVEAVAGLAAGLIALSLVTKAWAVIQALASVAVGVWNVAVGAATVAQTLWNVTMFAAEVPLLLIIAGIALLAVGIVELVKHWGDVENAAKDVFNWIKGNWPLLLAIILGPFGLAVDAIAAHWSDIKSGAKSLISWIEGAFGAVEHAIAAPFEAAFSAIHSAYEDSGIPAILSGLSKVTGAVGGVVGGILGHFADGGTNNMGSGSFLVGERGPEIVRLPGGASVTPNHQLGGSSTVTQVMSGGTDITQFVTSIVTKNTRATRNAVRAGATRAYT